MACEDIEAHLASLIKLRAETSKELQTLGPGAPSSEREPVIRRLQQIESQVSTTRRSLQACRHITTTPAKRAPRQILQIQHGNPPFDRADDWAKAIAGRAFPLADFEWTQVLAPAEEYDQFTLVGAVGWMVNPHHSSEDVPLTHPFRDEPSGTIFDWEFKLALDQNAEDPSQDYQFLLAAGNKEDTSAISRQIGIPVPDGGLLGVEIDGAFVPPGFENVVGSGDRIAVFGRWIIDTGHEANGSFKSEIHPPLLMASASIKPLEDGSVGTRALFTSRPYLVGQRFTTDTDRIYDDTAEDDGPLLSHLVKELVKVASPPIPVVSSLQVEAHPKIKSHPFRGVHLLHVQVRPPPLPPSQTIAAFKRIAVSFQFTVRSGCAVQVTSLSPNTVDVLISLNDAAYSPPPLPRRTTRKYSRDELDAMSPGTGIGTKILEGEAGTVLIAALGGGPANAAKAALILSEGIETDEYDPLPPVELADRSHAVAGVLAGAIPAGVGIVQNNTQPFPIFGWLEVKWVNAPLGASDAPSAGHFPSAGVPTKSA